MSTFSSIIGCTPAIRTGSVRFQRAAINFGVELIILLGKIHCFSALEEIKLLSDEEYNITHGEFKRMESDMNSETINTFMDLIHRQAIISNSSQYHIDGVLDFASSIVYGSAMKYNFSRKLYIEGKFNMEYEVDLEKKIFELEKKIELLENESKHNQQIIEFGELCLMRAQDTLV